MQLCSCNCAQCCQYVWSLDVIMYFVNPTLLVANKLRPSISYFILSSKDNGPCVSPLWDHTIRKYDKGGRPEQLLEGHDLSEDSAREAGAFRKTYIYYYCQCVLVRDVSV